MQNLGNFPLNPSNLLMTSSIVGGWVLPLLPCFFWRFSKSQSVI